MRQKRAKRILLDAKAVHLSRQLSREVFDARQQRVESLVGRDSKAEVAGKCFCFDEFGRQIGIERKIERMDDAVGRSEFDGLDACLQVVRLLEV